MVTPLPTKLCMGPDDAGPPCEDARAIPITARTLEQLVVKPGTSADLARRDTAWPSGPELAARDELKQGSKKALARGIEELSSAQELLWAAARTALLVVFQAMDAAGKDSTIKHVMSGVNPQGVQVVSLQAAVGRGARPRFPLAHPAARCPSAGAIGIFNRSYYEEVLVVRVHPELLERQTPAGASADEHSGRSATRTSTPSSATSRATAPRSSSSSSTSRRRSRRKRFLERARRPDEELEVLAPATSREREHWDEYMAAYEDMLARHEHEWAPWYVVPADHKWVMRALVADAILEAIHGLDLRWPEVSEEERRAGEEARRLLETET